MKTTNVSRRGLLGAGGAMLVTAAVARCDSSGEPSGGPTSAQPTGGGGEAPMLAARVEAGELPPVAERLPEVPLVVEPTDQIGVYGGEWNTVINGTDGSWMSRTIGYESLVRWTPQWDDLVANVAESFESGDDGAVWTFRLRRGLKWSDGEPFTADDVMFAYNDVVKNKDLFPQVSDRLMIGGEPAEIERVDDYAVRFTFPEPYGMFIPALATSSGWDFTNKPRHYLEKFHKSYNPDVEKLAAEEGQPSWVELFFTKANLWGNSELPRLHPWVVTTGFGEGSRVVAERNPYYWKVDPEGKQLPYLDRVVYDVISDNEVALLKAAAGEIDMQDRYISAAKNKPVLARDRKRGNYDFYEVRPSSANDMGLFLNLTHKDPVKREIFRNKDFRIGLSHAINRQEVIDVAFQRQGEPWQVAPRPDSEFHDEQMAKQYTEYDVDLANESLDRAGYSGRDDDGFRLGPDGQRISFTVETTAGPDQPWTDALQRIQDYWREVGIEARVTAEDRSLFVDRIHANEPDFTVWSGGESADYDLLLSPNDWIPRSRQFSKFAPAWAAWFVSGGSEGEEPLPEVLEQLRLHDRVRAAVGKAAQVEIMREILEVSKEQFYSIGISLPPTSFGIVRNDFHNVPESMPFGGTYPTPAPTNPEQYFTTGPDE